MSLGVLCPDAVSAPQREAMGAKVWSQLPKWDPNSALLPPLVCPWESYINTLPEHSFLGSQMGAV